MPKPPTVVRKRKVYGTAKNVQPMFLAVDPETKDKVEAISAAIGLSKAATMDLIIRHVQIDDDYCPDWWDGERVNDDSAQGRLDIAI